MASHVAALLYLLGRRIATALRVRVGDDELLLPRHAPLPLARLHDALAHGEDVMVDPWVDQPEGRRVLVCLWMRADTAEAAEAAAPADHRPQLVISQGRSSLLVWVLDTPTDRPGGRAPADALAMIADALDGQAGDPRDYIPVPPHEAALAIREPASGTDATALVQWAASVLEARSRAASLTTTPDAPSARGGSGGPVHHTEPSQDPWEVGSTWSPAEPVTGQEACADARAPCPGAGSATPLDAQAMSPPRRPDTPSPPGLSTPEGMVPPVLWHLLSLASRSCGVETDEALVQAVVRYAMATLGTAHTWDILGVSMTTVREGRLFGLRNGRWVPLLEASGSPTAPRRLTEEP